MYLGQYPGRDLGTTSNNSSTPKTIPQSTPTPTCEYFRNKLYPASAYALAWLTRPGVTHIFIIWKDIKRGQTSGMNKPGVKRQLDM